jgi:hypothetical protein
MDNTPLHEEVCPSSVVLTFKGDGYTLPTHKSVTTSYPCQAGAAPHDDHVAQVDERQVIRWRDK